MGFGLTPHCRNPAPETLYYWSDFMNTQTTLETVRTQTTAVMILAAANPPPLPIPERASTATKAAHFDPHAKPDNSAQFRADLLRRYDAPFALAWGHGGLND